MTRMALSFPSLIIPPILFQSDLAVEHAPPCGPSCILNSRSPLWAPVNSHSGAVKVQILMHAWDSVKIIAFSIIGVHS